MSVFLLKNGWYSSGIIWSYAWTIIHWVCW